jgi:hypothetical protein
MRDVSNEQSGATRLGSLGDRSMRRPSAFGAIAVFLAK